MIPIWIVVFFGSIFVAYVTMTAPQQKAQLDKAAAQVAAGNFIAYRKAVQMYLVNNPGMMTGTVSKENVLNVAYPEYIYNSDFSNVVLDGNLFVFATPASSKKIGYEIYNRLGNSMHIGVKSNTSKLLSYSGVDTGITLPSSIPVNSFVMIGR